MTLPAFAAERLHEISIDNWYAALAAAAVER